MDMKTITKLDKMKTIKIRIVEFLKKNPIVEKLLIKLLITLFDSHYKMKKCISYVLFILIFYEFKLNKSLAIYKNWLVAFC